MNEFISQEIRFIWTFGVPFLEVVRCGVGVVLGSYSGVKGCPVCLNRFVVVCLFWDNASIYIRDL